MAANGNVGVDVDVAASVLPLANQLAEVDVAAELRQVLLADMPSQERSCRPHLRPKNRLECGLDAVESWTPVAQQVVIVAMAVLIFRAGRGDLRGNFRQPTSTMPLSQHLDVRYQAFQAFSRKYPTCCRTPA